VNENTLRTIGEYIYDEFILDLEDVALNRRSREYKENWKLKIQRLFEFLDRLQVTTSDDEIRRIIDRLGID